MPTMTNTRHNTSIAMMEKACYYA